MNSTACLIILDTAESMRQTLSLLPQLDCDGISDIIIVNTTGEACTSIVPLHQTKLQSLDMPGAGYAKAANAGVNATEANILCFISAECQPTIHAIKNLIETLKNQPEAAIVSGKLTTGDNTYIPSARRFPGIANSFLRTCGLARRFPTTPLNCLEYSTADWNSPQLIDWTDFCFAAVKKETFQRLGLFDEGFSTRMATADFCLRALRSIATPNKIVYAPKNVCRVSAESVIAQAGSGFPLQYGNRGTMANDTLCFFRKRMGPFYALIATGAALLGSALLFAVTLLPLSCSAKNRKLAREQWHHYQSALLNTGLGKTSPLL